MSLLARDHLAGEQLPWIVEILRNECDRCPPTQLLNFIAHANDLLERLDSDWRITQSGEARKVDA